MIVTIHASREGCDLALVYSIYAPGLFQSTRQSTVNQLSPPNWLNSKFQTAIDSFDSQFATRMHVEPTYVQLIGFVLGWKGVALHDSPTLNRP